MKKSIFVLAALILAAVPAWSQAIHHNDDRDLFMGIDGGAGIRPNIMVLADNSGSMNTAIYHPAYNPKINYTKDAAGTNLNLDVDSDVFNFWEQEDVNVYSLKSFNICRGTSTSIPAWDARARFYSLYKGNLDQWVVYKSTISGVFPQNGQIIDYDGYGYGVNDHVTIEGVNDKLVKDAWVIEVSGVDGSWDIPASGGYIYINYHLETVQKNILAKFVPTWESCTGFDTTISNVQLYGGLDLAGTPHATDNPTRYDRNYLYWLAFSATEAQCAEVAYWATSGKYPDSTGTLVDFGYTRIEVLRRVLADVMREVHGDVNLGLAAFNSDNHGGYVRENLTNFNTLQALESMISNKIANLSAETWTPLAEALADVWYYMIGQNTSTLQPHTDSSIASDCPLEDYCQKQYVILMTDGESTQDELSRDGHSRFYDSYFAAHPVSEWGDEDLGAHDPDPATGVQPTVLTKPDGTPYCPNNTCWESNGTDYLDDVAWYMAKNDHFPDALLDPCYGLTGEDLAACSLKDVALPPGPDNYTPAYATYMKKYQGMQAIETYVIGFNVDNDMLVETAANGNGEYYIATSYDSLKTALTAAIVSIQLRDMAFAAFTAPKKITSTAGEGFSFVGYFLPSLVDTIWSGHLQSYRMTDRWFADKNDNLVQDEDEDDYPYEQDCTVANPGHTCRRIVELDKKEIWDMAGKLGGGRNLFTHDSATALDTLIPFTDANISTLQPLFQLEPNADPAVPLAQAETIIATLNGSILGDIFHSDIAYVGAPLLGKKYVKNLNPVDCNEAPLEDDPDCFEYLLKNQAARDKVLYVGTNDGILHQVEASEDPDLGGKERWGFIPDEVLPSLKNIFINKQYTYTLDGRLLADDIYYRKGEVAAWKTILIFGLKDGGDAFYCLDITDADSNPVVLWKFKDADYSGRSWSKPVVGKIRELQTDGTLLDRWVVVLSGGMAFNNEDPGETAGKAVFVVDASTGELIWMVGYNASGAEDATATAHIDTTAVGARNLTQKPEFNYPIPSAITPVDRDSDGFLDTIYFGNVAGHLFKADISSADAAYWKTYQLYKKEGLHTAPQASTTISSIAGNVFTLDSKATGFELHRNVFQPATGAMGTIDMIDSVKDNIVTITTISPSAFAADASKPIIVPSYDPIFLSPAVFFDNCYNLWVAFGSGDRIRSRTNPDTGKFIALRDGKTVVSSATVQKTDILLSDLVPITWTGSVVDPVDIKVDGKWGWQFTFPMAWNHEKLFDPEPIVLPGLDLVPHIYFNTYQPSTEESLSDCDAPKNGLMYYYDLTCNYCGDGTLSGMSESGRIAGGGVFQGTDYVIYQGDGNVASIPPLQAIKPIKLIYTGSMLFMKEKKR